MSITYQQIERQVSAALGTITGGVVSTAETNYTATGDTSTRNSADFPPTMVIDAILGAMTDIVSTICETPHHPERAAFAAVTATLANRDTLPRVTSTSAPIIGTFGRCYDATNNNELIPASLDVIRAYNRNPNSMYTAMGLNLYYYAFTGNAIEHTRTGVKLDCCTWTRPTFSANSNIPLEDYHERGLVAGAVVMLCPREAAYLDAWQAENAVWQAHLTAIRNLGDPASATDAQTAPSVS